LGVGVALLVIGLAGWTGLKARATGARLAASRGGWETTGAQLATVQQQFRVPSATEASALVAEASRMSALGVPFDDRLSLVDMLGHLAEALSLSAVRVNLVPVPDSAVIPSRQVVGSSVRPASYAIAVEFVGRFADAQKFVSSLPPSVSLSRLNAARRDGGALYKLILSVYEIDANPGNR
jgi:hypothetical protein